MKNTGGLGEQGEEGEGFEVPSNKQNNAAKPPESIRMTLSLGTQT